MDITAWLRSLGLEQYAPAFRDNAVDAEVLPELIETDLERLGVELLGHRKKLLKAIATLRVEMAATLASVADGQNPSAPPASMQGERRQVTVLFADLAGYTRLTRELGAEAMHELTGRFFELVDGLIERFGGSVDKHIGDCVMAVFGAPVAHGNDPERAIRAALAIRDAVPALGVVFGQPLDVHIGVASGQVVAGTTGGRLAHSLTGDTVNLASRLTDEAASGQILVADDLRRLLGDRLQCGEALALAAKGFAQPIKAHRLKGIAMPKTAPRAFVGRRAELGQIIGVLRTCLEIGIGQAVHLRGDAGIGKTRLAEECLEQAKGQGYVGHVSLVLDFGTATGHDAIRALARDLLGLHIGSAAEEAAGAADRALAAGLVVRELQVHLNDLLNLELPAELRLRYDAMDNAARQRGRLDALRQLVQNLSRQAPRLIIVEDVHWADTATLDHLVELTQLAASCPLVVIMTSRPEGEPLDQVWRARIGDSRLLTIDLRPLQPEDTSVLARAYVDATNEFARRCIERAGGNPLFLEQLLRFAKESAETDVPGSIQSLVQARIDRLDPPDKAALQAASVLGQHFDPNALSHILDRPNYAARRLATHCFIRPQGDAFLFSHALIRDAIYETLLKSRRCELHRRAADWFAGGRDPVLHAEHLDRAEAPEAAHAYLVAARTQADQYRNERALTLVERGLALATDPMDVFALASMRGDLLHNMGRIADAIEAHRHALKIAGSDAERCRAWLGLAAGMRITDQYNEACGALDEAEAAATRNGLVVELAHVHHLRGNLCFPLGQLDDCLRQHELAFRYAQEAGSPELEARALGGLGDAYYASGRPVSASGYFNQCIEIARANGFVRVEVANLHMQIGMLWYLMRLEDALKCALAAVELATAIGDRRAEMITRRMIGGLFLDHAELDQAQVYHEDALALARHLSARRFEPMCLLHLGKISALRGDGLAARELLEQATLISRQTGLKFSGPAAFAASALVAETPEMRRAALDEGEAILHTGAVGLSYLWFYRDAMEACLAARWWAEVDRYASALEDYTRVEAIPWADFHITRGRALAAYGLGQRDAVLKAKLERVRDDAERGGFRLALRAIDAALCDGLSN